MTKAQLSIILVSAAVLVGMALLPPWVHHTDNGARQSMGYGPLWQPPVAQQEQGINIFGLKLEVEEQIRASKVDWERLFLQALMVIVVGGGAYLVLGKGTRASH